MLKTSVQTLEDFRSDGRKPKELRKMDIKLGIDNSVDGSSSVKLGLNEVICLIKGPYPVENTL